MVCNDLFQVCVLTVQSKRNNMKAGKKREGKKVSTKKSAKKGKPNTEEGKPEDFDFGGLPDRDLKKNLGCG